jgi:hypothetical protein
MMYGTQVHIVVIPPFRRARAARIAGIGATIVTFNTADCALIGRYVDITFVEPWPRQPAA